ncbi:MAG: CD3324 family protein [Aminipila sp.]
MSYIKATQLLPIDLLVKVQEYVDGKCIYIPKLDDNKHEWGANTSTREELKIRNKRIYEDYLKGQSADYLSHKYFLSVKSIQRIIRQQK